MRSRLCQIQAIPPTTTIPTVPYDPCNCGVRKTSRIVGGTAAGVNEFPFQAALVSNTTRSIFCGAEIISNRRALTARHCLAGQSPSLVGLLVGDSDTSTGSDTPYTSLYLIQAFTCFGGNCNTNDQANDIAMVLTVNQIQMNPGVNIICLPIKYNTNTANQFAGTKVVAAGWGDTEFGGIGSNTLQKVTLDVITTAQCQSRYGNSITVNHICTSTFGRDTCQRDSGTSLMYTGTDNGRMYTVGVVSFGVECGTNPSVSTRVTSYVNWIRSNSPESSYCSV
uniref:Putative trypsin n=1 Tax=Nyssomyia neivai TaxID=330878 RepID=A0A1L8DQX8_9DIPT